MLVFVALVVYAGILVNTIRNGSPFAIGFVVLLGALTIGAAMYTRRKRGDS